MRLSTMKLTKSVILTVLLLAGLCSTSNAAPKAVVKDKLTLQVSALLAKMTQREKLLQLLSYVPNGVPRLGIPSIEAGEGLHGALTQGATCFPQAIGMASTWDPALINQIGIVVGQEARAVGLDQVFAPMLGLARDPRWGRVEESYGEDPYLAAQLGVAYIEGAQGVGKDRLGPDHVICTPKHFVADGEPWGGHNGESLEISDRELHEVFLQPFEAAITVARAESIMPAHHPINGVPCHANPWLLGTLLRGDWGFDGFVTSDMSDVSKLEWGHHYAVGADHSAAALALNAGVDMELAGSGPTDHVYWTELPGDLAKGLVTQATIDRAVTRVLRAKIQLLGLGSAAQIEAAQKAITAGHTLTNNPADQKADPFAEAIKNGSFTTPAGLRRPDADKVLNDPAHDQLALKAADEAMVLLKNDNSLLPLDRNRVKSVLIVGPLAVMQNTGGYSSNGSRPYVNVVAGMLQEPGLAGKVVYDQGCSLTDQDDSALLTKAFTDAKNADVVVAVVGHSRDQVGENLDRDNLDLIGGQERLVEAMSATGKPVVVVLENGAPLTIDWIAAHVPAIVESWYGGQKAGTAIAQTLFGDLNPGGKMPVSVPKNLGQIPCYYNHYVITGPSDYYASNWKNLFVFGQGLSYTSFAYSGLKVEPAQILPTQTAKVSVVVKNTGQRAGDEVPQLYLHQTDTSLEQPVQLLKGFQRITLQPGEQKTVSFTVGYDQLKFWKEHGWATEPGIINIQVGSSCEDIRQTGSLTLLSGKS